LTSFFKNSKVKAQSTNTTLYISAIDGTKNPTNPTHNPNQTHTFFIGKNFSFVFQGLLKCHTDPPVGGFSISQRIQKEIPKPVCRRGRQVWDDNLRIRNNKP
jgi:hypothetical protein